MRELGGGCGEPPIAIVVPTSVGSFIVLSVSRKAVAVGQRLDAQLDQVGRVARRRPERSGTCRCRSACEKRVARGARVAGIAAWRPWRRGRRRGSPGRGTRRRGRRWRRRRGSGSRARRPRSGAAGPWPGRDRGCPVPGAEPDRGRGTGSPRSWQAPGRARPLPAGHRSPPAADPRRGTLVARSRRRADFRSVSGRAKGRHGYHRDAHRVMEDAFNSAGPVVLAVDDDATALALIERGLTQRYGWDYRVVCELSPGAALAALRTMQDEGIPVAVVLAAQWMSEIEGTELLAEVGRLHPHAKRGLLIDWGAWGDPPTAEAIFQGMAQRHMDYYVMKPLQASRRAVPSHGGGVPPRMVPSAVARGERDHSGGAPVVHAGARAPEPAGPKRRAALVPFERLGKGTPGARGGGGRGG